MTSSNSHFPTTRTLGSVLLLAGLALTVFSLIADWIGIGGGKGFGYQQMIVLIAGIVLILGGVRLVAQPFFNHDNQTPDSEH